MKSISKLLMTASLCALGGSAAPALAQATMDHAKAGAMPMAAAAAGGMTDAEVRKVDKEQGKVTLKHGPITNLDMPGMTMVFTAKDKSMLDKLKAGDKVKFKAAMENGKVVVVDIVAAP